MKKRKIAYITGGRMDFGLMLSTLKKIEKSSKLSLQVYYTGIHLMSEFGDTYKQVLREFPDSKKINAIYKNDDKLSSLEFLSNFIKSLTKEFKEEKPDVVLVLGDRAEMLGAAVTSLYFGISVAHIHGGEKTGHIDEIVRHAITKLSHIHFVANDISAERIRKMGEDNFRIFTVGAPGIDEIVNSKIVEKEELIKFLEFKKNTKFIFLVQHPVFNENSALHIKKIVKAVKYFKLPVVVIYPNADAGGRKMIKIIDKEINNPIFRIYPNVERKIFLSLEKYASVWVTNSSAGIIESPSFCTPVVNVGTRQKDRLKAENIINVDNDEQNIIEAINKSLNDKNYLKNIKKIKNPWGNGQTGRKIVNVLENIPLDSILLNKQISY